MCSKSTLFPTSCDFFQSIYGFYFCRRPRLSRNCAIEKPIVITRPFRPQNNGPKPPDFNISSKAQNYFFSLFGIGTCFRRDAERYHKIALLYHPFLAAVRGKAGKIFCSEADRFIVKPAFGKFYRLPPVAIGDHEHARYIFIFIFHLIDAICRKAVKLPVFAAITDDPPLFLRQKTSISIRSTLLLMSATKFSRPQNATLITKLYTRKAQIPTVI